MTSRLPRTQWTPFHSVLAAALLFGCSSPTSDESATARGAVEVGPAAGVGPDRGDELMEEPTMVAWRLDTRRDDELPLFSGARMGQLQQDVVAISHAPSRYVYSATPSLRRWEVPLHVRALLSPEDADALSSTYVLLKISRTKGSPYPCEDERALQALAAKGEFETEFVLYDSLHRGRYQGVATDQGGIAWQRYTGLACHRKK